MLGGLNEALTMGHNMLHGEMDFHEHILILIQHPLKNHNRAHNPWLMMSEAGLNARYGGW